MGVVTPLGNAWAVRRFGVLADRLADAVADALARAQESAYGAYVAAGLSSRDAYGATMGPALHRELAQIPGSIEGLSIRKPEGVGGRFPYVVVDDAGTALWPIRYADKAVAISAARLRLPVSPLRRTLLAPTTVPASVQPTFEDTLRDPDAIDADERESADLLRQLSVLGTVVTIGYASNPSGILVAGWGDVELEDAATGALRICHWETLPVRSATTTEFVAAPRRLLQSAGQPAFDDGADDDGFGLTLRAPLSGPPVSEPTSPSTERAASSGQSDSPR